MERKETYKGESMDGAFEHLVAAGEWFSFLFLRGVFVVVGRLVLVVFAVVPRPRWDVRFRLTFGRIPSGVDSWIRPVRRLAVCIPRLRWEGFLAEKYRRGGRKPLGLERRPPFRPQRFVNSLLPFVSRFRGLWRGLRFERRCCLVFRIRRRMVFLCGQLVVRSIR